MTHNMDKHTHGGKREGAGRKQGEKTIRLYVPVSIAPAVITMIKKHKAKGGDMV